MEQQKNNWQTLDLRDLNCPEPVLRTKQYLSKGNVERVDVLVQDLVNVENLKRLASSLSCHCYFLAEADYFRVSLSRKTPHGGAKHPDHITESLPHQSHDTPPQDATNTSLPINQEKLATRLGTVIFITKDKLGEGSDDQFGTNLLHVFLQSIFQSDRKPKAILMANSGVKLMERNSPFLTVLNDFREQGVDVLACGLCVEFYGLSKDIPAEQITNMFSICQYLLNAEQVLSF